MSRISNTGLLILIGFSIPVLIELRTLLSFVNIEVSARTTMLVGGLYIAALIIYGRFPDGSSVNS
ncbi:hypothetical protein [Natranaeroarchaeum sulfidigenes]|uniref:Putative membrane protein n=1 Tax=Natranaeroarchaeum sulfidigenes TaxID=2784880 RepID=A0A897MNT9_9EURY|nr:hypothetical protein [Natranaeroarchaeum sulfidigenes]QSG02021.1 putative membrane protein [Natranaeroarchaeum sulfidigenes]